MKKLTIVVIALGLLAAACGGAGGEADNLAQIAETTIAVPGEALTTVAPDSGSLPSVTEAPIFKEETDSKPVPTTSGTEPQPVEEDVSHPDANVALAMTDLVGRTGVDADAINVVSVDEVTWSDGSLGCPLPGMRYTQALVNGTRIVLEADGVVHEYHSGAGREPFYCANPSDPVSGDYGDY